MRVIAWGTYDLSKPRTRILLDALGQAGVEVEEIHTDVWSDVRDKSQIRGFGTRAAFALRWVRQYGSLVARYLARPKADVVLIGYLGQLDVLLIRPLAALRGERVVWDAFISLYDTVVNDRKMSSENGVIACALFAWEWIACRAADVVLLDTDAHARFFRDTFALRRRGHASSVFVGAEGEAFAPAPARSATSNKEDSITALFYGQFIPLHGIETIIHAARASDPSRIRWVIIGQGQEEPKIRAMLDEQPLPHLEWIPWVDYEQLGQHIAAADVCLGIFGTSDKAARVIPNKVFQILTVGKPLVTRDSPGIRELLAPDSEGVYLVPPADPRALLDAIERCRADRPLLHEPLHRDVIERFSPEAIGIALRRTLEQVVQKRR